MRANLTHLLLWAAAATFVTTLPLLAQNTRLLQIPAARIAVGIAPSASQTVCANSIPTSKGTQTGDGCPPTQAILSGILSTVTDSYGNVYFADAGNGEVRVLYRGNPALAAAIIASYANTKLVATPTPGLVYDLAGGGSLTNTGAAGGAGYSTSITPSSIALDSDGNVFFGDSSTRVRVFYVGGTKLQTLLTKEGSPASGLKPGYVYPLIVASVAGYSGDGGPGYNATLTTQHGLVVDSSENVYIADYANNAVRMISSTTGNIATIVGGPGCVQGTKSSCTASSTGDGGPATSATTNEPAELAFDPNGNLYIAEYAGARVRALYLGNGTLPGVTSPQTGYIYTVVGGGSTTASGGLAAKISLKSASGLGFDSAGQLYIADSKAATLWEVDAASQITVIIAGGGVATTTGGPCVSANSTGSISSDTVGDNCPSTQALLKTPEGKIVFDAANNVYFADSGNNILRQLTFGLAFPTTAVGSSTVQTTGFFALSTQTLATPTLGVQGVVTADFMDNGHSTCVANPTLAIGGSCLLNITFTPQTPGQRSGFAQLSNTTSNVLNEIYLAASATGASLAVDTGTQTAIGTGLKPSGIAVTSSGSIYIADSSTNSLLQYANSSTTTPVKLATGLSSPAQVTVDGEGNVAVADTGNNRIALYRPATQTVAFLTDGLSAPTGVVADTAGDLFVADTNNNRIVEFYPSSATRILPSAVIKPTRLALDSNGNLYIIDSGNSRVVMITPASGAQTTISTGTVTPSSVAIDPAGDLYLLDPTALNVTTLSPSGATSTLLSGLIAPADLALDQTNSLYVADPGQTSALAENRQLKSINFGANNVGETSAATSFLLSNTGNTTLTFSQSAIASLTGNAPQFSITPALTNGCASTTLLAGSSCGLQATFTPTATGSFTSAATFPSNATTNTTVDLSGSGVILTSTRTTITLVSPANANGLTYGTPITISVAVAPTSGSGNPTGSITIAINGIQQQILTVGSVSTYTFTPTAGSVLLSAAYSGDTQFAASNTSLSLTIAPAPTSTTLSVTSTLSSTAPSLTLTAQVSSPIAGLSGPVTFSSGATTLGTVSVNAQGVAVLNVTNLSLNSLDLAAAYAGTTNFAPSISSITTLDGDFGFTSASTFAAVQGGIAARNLTLIPYFNLAGTIAFACGGLPVNSVCRFSPQTVTFPGSTNVTTTVQLQIFTNATTTLAANQYSSVQRLALATLFGFVCLIGLRNKRHTLLLAALILAAWADLSGCGTSSLAGNDSAITPAGTYPITITATAPGGTTHTIALNFTVTGS